MVFHIYRKSSTIAFDTTKTVTIESSSAVTERETYGGCTRLTTISCEHRTAHKVQGEPYLSLSVNEIVYDWFKHFRTFMYFT